MLKPRLDKHHDLIQSTREIFPESSIGLIGCFSAGLDYPVCELDLLITTKNNRKPERLLIENRVIDAFFIKERAIKELKNNHLRSTIGSCVPVQDKSWILASAISRSKSAGLQLIRRKLAREETNKILLGLGAATSAYKEGYNQSGGYWMLYAGYSILKGLILSSGLIPSPAHLLDQIKNLHIEFTEAENKALNLSEASISSIKRRLEFFEHVWKTWFKELENSNIEYLFTSSESLNLISEKTRYLADNHRVVEAFTYIGFEIVRLIKAIYLHYTSIYRVKTKYHRIIEEIEEKIFGEIKIDSDQFNKMGIRTDVEENQKMIEKLKLKSMNLTQTRVG